MTLLNIKPFLLIFALSIFTSSIQAQEWTSWRGPNGNGISSETDWNPAAIKNLKINWTKELGIGYSAVAVKDKCLYSMGFQDGSNVIYCLNAGDGKEIWRYEYKSVTNNRPGTRCTPIVDNGLIYTVGQAGDLYCNDAKTGKVIWFHQIQNEFKYEPPKWGFSSSVLISDDVLYLNAGNSGIAFNKSTGKLKWASKSGIGNYATPVRYLKNKQRMIAVYGKDNLFGVDASSGKVEWQFPWSVKYDLIAADPVVINHDNMIFISSGNNKGCALIDISSGKPIQLWKNDDMCNQFSTSIQFDDYLYGVDGNAGSGELKCMSIKDGKVAWSQDLGFGNLMATANKYIIFISEKGNLHIIKADPNGFHEIASAEKILPKFCWTAPVLCGKTLYVRNSLGTILSIDMR